MYEEEDNSKEQKFQHLSKLKTKSKKLHTVDAVLATTLSIIYFYYVVRYVVDMMN